MHHGKEIIVGTRGSPLALVQAEWAIARLFQLHPELNLRPRRIRTRGDIHPRQALARMRGRGIFVKEMEEALLAGEIDLAVHSLKDLPTKLPPGLAIGAIGPRLDPRDALLSSLGQTLDELPEGAIVGTSSPRRKAQLLSIRPDLVIREIRGNVDTRLRKLGSEEYDAIVLAIAGLERLGCCSAISQYLPLEVMLPAPGQGALVLEIREEDQEVAALVSGVNDPATEAATRAERAFLATFGGGCSAAIAAYGAAEGGELLLSGLVASLDGRRLLRDQAAAPVGQAQALGETLARRLRERGADEIIGQAGAS